MMKPQKEKEFNFFMIKIKEGLRFKSLTKIGEKFQLKNNIKVQDCSKMKKSLHNGNHFILFRVVKLMQHYKDQKGLHKRYTLQLIEKCKQIV